jgi:hypothetical protein
VLVYRFANLLAVNIGHPVYLGGTYLYIKVLVNHFVAIGIAVHLAGKYHQLLYTGANLETIFTRAKLMLVGYCHITQRREVFFLTLVNRKATDVLFEHLTAKPLPDFHKFNLVIIKVIQLVWCL